MRARSASPRRARGVGEQISSARLIQHGCMDQTHVLLPFLKSKKGAGRELDARHASVQ